MTNATGSQYPNAGGSCPQRRQPTAPDWKDRSGSHSSPVPVCGPSESARRAVKAIGQDAADPIRRFLLERCTLKLPIGLRKGCRTGVRGIAQMPEHTTTDNGREIDLVSETATVLLVGQEIHGEGQTVPGEHRHQTLVAKRTDQAIERHRGDMPDDRTQLQAQSSMGGQEGIAGSLRSHLAIAQDEVREDREYRFARRALYPPNGHSTQTDADIMRVAGEAPASMTGRLVLELEAKRQHEGKDTLEKGLPIAKQLKVRRFVSKIHSNGPVFAGLFDCDAHVSPLGYQVSSA